LVIGLTDTCLSWIIGLLSIWRQIGLAWRARGLALRRVRIVWELLPRRRYVGLKFRWVLILSWVRLAIRGWFVSRLV